jgi:hypothetical protein
MEGLNMFLKKLFRTLIFTLILLVVVSELAACTSTNTLLSAPSPTPSKPAASSPTETAPQPGGPGGGAIINSDSIISANIQAIRQQTSGYPWELDIMVQTSQDVGTLPNPTKDSVGKVITVKTDEDMSKYKVNDLITAKVKYVGDVPRPGITLDIYNVALKN